MRTAMARRSSPGTSEHKCPDSASGNMGIARFGKYTLTPRASAARKLLQRHSIVEVARSFRIDGGEGHGSQVSAVVEVRRLNDAGDLADLAYHRGREFLGDVGASQGFLDLGARVVGAAEDLEQHDFDGCLGRLGIADDLGDQGLTGAGIHATANHDLRLDARIVGLEAHLVAVAGELSGDFAAPTFEHLGDAAFEPAPANPPFDLDAVAVHGRTAVADADVDIF